MDEALASLREEITELVRDMFVERVDVARELLDRARDSIVDLLERTSLLEQRMATGSAAIVALEQANADTDEAVDALEEQVVAAVHRADVLTAIPETAPRAYLFMVPGDPNLYVGAGAGALRKLPTLPI